METEEQRKYKKEKYSPKDKERWMKWYHSLSEPEKLAYNRSRYVVSRLKQNNPIHQRVYSHQKEIKKTYPEIFARSTITNSILRDWYNEQKGTDCKYCGHPGDSIDHKIPLSKGGEHSLDNLQFLCLFCNISKHNHSEEWFISKCRAVANRHKI